MRQSKLKLIVNRATGRWLKRVRADKELSQTELQNYLGVTRSYISTMEQGKKPLPVWRLIKLCRDLDIDCASAIKWIEAEAFSGESRKNESTNDQ